MKRRMIMTLLLAGTMYLANAQGGIRYHGMVQGGVIHGAQDPAFLVQTIQGISYKTWSAGLGAGVDAYFRKSAPLFIDLRKKILDQANSPFLFAGFGRTIVLDETEKTMYMNTRYKGGSYYDIGLGYQWDMQKKTAFHFSIGYSQKQITETANYFYIFDPFIDKMEYTLRRLTLKAGLSF